MSTQTEKKYSWNFRITWVVEFVRKDAEIGIDLDGKRIQKVITRGCKSTEEAELIATDYCRQLAEHIEGVVMQQVQSLRDAKE